MEKEAQTPVDRFIFAFMLIDFISGKQVNAKDASRQFDLL